MRKMKNMNNRIMALVGVVGMTVGILGLNMTDYVDTGDTTVTVNVSFTCSLQIPASLEQAAESASTNIIDRIYLVGAREYIPNSQSVEIFAVDGFNMSVEDGVDEGMFTVAHVATNCANSMEGKGLDYMVTSGDSVAVTTRNVPVILKFLGGYTRTLTFASIKGRQLMRKCWSAQILTIVCKVLLVHLSILVRTKWSDGYLEDVSGNDEELGEEPEAEQKYTYKRFIKKMILAVVVLTRISIFGVRVNEKTNHIFVFCNDGTVIDFARSSKGYEEIEETPIEFYGGLLIHDRVKSYCKDGLKSSEMYDAYLPLLNKT